MTLAAQYHSHVSRGNKKPTGFTHSNVKNALKELAEAYRYAAEKRWLKLSAVCICVCEHFGMDFEKITRKTRVRCILEPRQIFIYLAKYNTDHSLKDIGDFLGGFDHTTIMLAVRKIQNLIDTEPAFNQLVKDIEHLLRLKAA